MTLELFDKLFSINDITIFFGYLPDIVKENFLNECSEDIEKLLIKTLEKEDLAIEIGLPLSLSLFRIKFPIAERILKEGVVKWLFHGNSTTIDYLIKNYIQLIKGYKYIIESNTQKRYQVRLFDNKDLNDLMQNLQCPIQLKKYIKERI